MTKITVAIPTYRGRPWIRACLQSVLDSRPTTPHVMVFDNASEDGTRDIVAEEFPQVELTKSPTNVGFARAANHLISRSIGRGDDFVFLLNEDTRIQPATLANLINVAEKHDVAILIPEQYDYKGWPLERDFSDLVEREALEPSLWRKEEFVPTKRIIGAAMLLRLSVIQKIGPFDPMYFLYAEEEDLCRRANCHGYKVGLSARAKIFHGHHTTSDYMSLERLRRLNLLRSKYILALKNPKQSMARAFVAFAASVVRDLKRLFGRPSLAAAADVLVAVVQVMFSLGQIRERRRMEKSLSPELWTPRQTGLDAGMGE